MLTVEILLLLTRTFVFQIIQSNQRDFTKNQLGFLSNLLYGSAPLTTDSRVSTFESQPGLFSNLVGTGLMGAGLMREYGRS